MNLICKEVISELDFSNLSYNLITYKKEENYYYYIITYIYKLNICILYYKVAENGRNELISNNTFTPFYLDYPAIKIDSMYLSCEIMDSCDKGDVLTCVFTTTEGNFIVIQSFQITKNFEPIGDDISFTKIPRIFATSSELSPSDLTITEYAPSEFVTTQSSKIVTSPLFSSSLTLFNKSACALYFFDLFIRYVFCARFVRYGTSSIALFPPPTTATVLPLKNPPSQIAQ